MNLLAFSPAFRANAAARLCEERYRRELDRHVLRAQYPRRNESWTPAEDRRLLRLVDKFKPTRHGEKRDRWRHAAKKLGRTDLAVQSRYYGLRAGLRLARMLHG